MHTIHLVCQCIILNGKSLVPHHSPIIFRQYSTVGTKKEARLDEDAREARNLATAWSK